MVTKKSNPRIFSILFTVAMFVGIVAFPYPAHAAAIIVVNSNADTIANDGACTLREAITNANNDNQSGSTDCTAGAGADTIYFNDANYTITLVDQLPAVTTAITINGYGEVNTIIQANAVPNTATYRVFEVGAAGNLTLNSLTVRNGRCILSCATNTSYGGGIYNDGILAASIVTFSGNHGNDGGGMYNTSISNATLTNVTFSANSAPSGGGMYNYRSSPTLTNVTFSGNSATAGGGMLNFISNPTLTNVTFSANSATNYGGGVYNTGSNPMLTNVTFSANSTTNYGGGMYNYDSSPTLTNVTFASNSGQWGGGMYNLFSSPTLTNVTFSANSATNYGGGMFNSGSNSTLTNVTFSANSATTSGGGMLNSGSNPTLTNVTFSANSATTSGSGMYNGGSSSPTLTNVIIANSVSGDCYNNTSTLNASSSNNLIEDAANACGLTNGVNGNIIGSDPMLGALANNGGFTQTMALLSGSPAIDAGDDAKCPATDQRGLIRPQGSHCDMGVYEYRHVIHYVKSNAGGANNGTSWANAYTDLQSALSVSLLSDEIWVAAGTYKPTTGTDRAVSFVLKSGVAVYGGFAGTETLRTQRNSAANVTTLSGEIGAAGIADNSYHVVEGSDIDNTSVLDGFSITAGNGKDVPFQDPWGGGMRVFLGSPTLSNLIFTSNTAFAGGGIVLDNSNSILTNVTFNGNSTSFGGGGGMLVVAGTPTLRNVTFNGNLAASGGGMSNSNASPFLENVTFNGNIASGSGGGIYNGLSDSILKNVTFSGNTAAISGGAIFNDESNPIITNGILWGNTGGEITNILGGSPVVTYSIVQGGYAGTGNLNADPLLGVLANNGGYTQTMALGAGSPAINTGTDTGCPATDQRGVARPQGSHCDIGAYESPASGDFAWAKGIGGIGDDDGNSIFVDSNNNVYTTGSFQGTVDFDPGAGVSNLTSAGADDIFVSKSDSNGTLLWAKRMGGASGDYGLGITVDSSGNIYTTGYFFGTADFDPGVGTVNLVNAGGSDVFISKLDGSGNFVWAKSMGETSHEYGSTIAIDLNGNIYTIGVFGDTVDFNPAAGVSNLLTSAGLTDVFVSKLDNNGNFVWAKSMGGTGAESGYSITLDSNSNVYIVGEFQLTADFDPNAGISNLISAGADDIYISKLDGNGNLLWAKSVGGTGVDYGNDIELDSSGNIYTMGHFQNIVDFNPSLIDTSNLTSAGGFDIFVSKLDNSGNFLWAKNMGGTSNDFGFNMVLDTYGDVYTTGSFQGTSDFDPSVGVSNLTSVGAEDIFLSKLNTTGNFLWKKGMGGTLGDQGFGIALDLIGNIYTIGSFQGMADFDPGVDVFNLISSGGKDIFISKLYNDINPIVSSIIRTNPSPTFAVSVNFTVNFSESVTGVDAGDFTLTTTGSVSGAAVSGVSGSGSVYTVTVNTGSGNGTIRLDVVDNNSIVDAASNPLGGAAVGDGNFTTGEVYTINKPFAPASLWTTSFDLSHGWTVADFVRTVGDVNNDGRDDLIGFGLDGVYVALSTGTGFGPISRWTTAFDLSHGWTVKDFVRTVGDVNNDGRDDLIGFGLDGVYVALSNGTSFGAISRWTTAFDLSHGWTVKDFVRTVGDVNNDGRDDLIGFGLDGVYVALSTGTSFGAISRWTTSFDLSHGWTVADFVRTVGDVNNDGRDDLIGFGLDGVYVALSNGTSFGSLSRWTTSFDLSHGWTVSGFVRTVGDVNLDGRDDLLGFGVDGVYVALSNGASFDSVSRWTNDFDLSHGWTVSQFVRTVGDVNNDGKADLVGFGLDGVYIGTAK